MLNLNGRKVAVLGLGDTGWSMTRWLARHGARVSVADTRVDIKSAPPYAEQLRAEFPDVPLRALDEAALRDADMIAISPGIDRKTPAIDEAIRRGVPVVGDIELFAQSIASRRALVTNKTKVVAITGTNGKSTVTEMVGGICKNAGLRTAVAGNIGTPVLDTLAEIEDGAEMPEAFVLELSSFQLESTEHLNADAATMLNLTDDHLDRYAGLEAYADAKRRVFLGDGAQVLNRDDAYSAGMALPNRNVQRFGLGAPQGEREWGIVANHLVRGGKQLMPVKDLPVAGLHNAANALAAGALAHALGISDEAIVGAWRNFKGLPHRVEKVAEVNGVTFYDDSKGTNVGSTVAALNGFTQKVVLIAGGDGKGQDFAPLRTPVATHARAVILLGRDREQLAETLAEAGVLIEQIVSMDVVALEEAVQRAFELSRPGDVVLLSPACASLDMFRNYKHRGVVFAAAVRALVKNAEVKHG